MLDRTLCNVKRNKSPYLDSPVLWYILRRQTSLPVRLVVPSELEVAALVTGAVLDLGFLML